MIISKPYNQEMKHTLIALLALLAIAISCQNKKADPAAELLEKIETLYANGKYQAALDSITELRNTYPKAIEARKRCLTLWDDATLKLTQIDIGKTDVLLQSTLQRIEQEHDRYTANMLRVKRDSLQARYEALCAIAHKIQAKKKNQSDVGYNAEKH